MQRTSEKLIACAIVALLKRRPDKRATIAELRDALPTVVKFTKADREESPTRPGEALWHQRLRNIRCHGAEKKYGLRCIAGGFVLVAKPPAHVVVRLREIRQEARAS